MSGIPAFSDVPEAGGSRSISTSFLVRLRARHPQAWERLLDLYGLLVYWWCRQSGLQPPDAADILQDVFQAAWSGIDGFHRDRPGDSFRAWLRTITKNKICDQARQWNRHGRAAGGSEAYQRFQSLTGGEQDTDAVSIPMVGLVHACIDSIRHEFGDHVWDSFWGTAVDGRLSADIAEELGITAAAVRQNKRRVLLRLRQELGDLP